MDPQGVLFSSFCVEKSAVFSECRKYRYQLTRHWDSSLGYINYLMLNPSTADETEDDPTISRQTERTKRLGFGGLRITNLFAWRSTDPSVLPSIKDPVGPDNNAYILYNAIGAEMVICGWGNHGSMGGRSQIVRDILRSNGISLRALRITGENQPQHPLYLPYSLTPETFL